MQPWATLIALGEKRYETRSWRTRYRGPLAIHSSKKTDKQACRQEPYRTVLAKHGFAANDLPMGVVLATCRLVDCLQVVENDGRHAVLDNGHVVSGNEYYFGNFGAGRFAWAVADVRLLHEFIPAKGKLGLWELPPANGDDGRMLY